MQQLSAMAGSDCRLLHLILWISVHHSEFRLVYICDLVDANRAGIACQLVTDSATAGSNSCLPRSESALGLHK